jgi:hypothetical protein
MSYNVLHELWALHELFRRMGFPSIECFMLPDTHADDGRPTCGVAVIRGDEKFGMNLPPLPTPIDPLELAKAWGRFITHELRGMNDAALEPIWEASIARREVAVILALLYVQAPVMAREVQARVAAGRLN